MFKKLALALILGFLAFGEAPAQNPQCPDRPKGDSTNACANTRFVQQNAGGGGAIVVTSVAGITCNGVADDTAGFATLATSIGTGGAQIIFPDGADCRVTSWNMASKVNVRITGPTGWDKNHNNTFGARLVCTVTGTGVCFDFSNAKGITFQHIEFACSQLTYTGTLFSFSQTASTDAGISFSNVQVHQLPGVNCRPGGLVYLGNAVNTYIEYTKFEHATTAIIGAFNGETTKDSAVLVCVACSFISMDGAAVVNPGSYWSFIGSWFFAKDNGDASGILQTHATVVTSLGFTDTIFSDGTSIAGIWIDLDLAADVRNLSLKNVTFGGGARGVKTRDTAGMYFQGHFVSTNTGIEFTGTCDGVVVEATRFSVAATPYTGSTCTNSVFAGNNGASSNLTTGTVNVVYSTAPTITSAALITPAIGVATGTSLTLTGGNIAATFNQAASSTIGMTNTDGAGTATLRAIGSGGTASVSAVQTNASFNWTGSGTLFFNSTVGQIAFFTANVERFRIDATGRVNFTQSAAPTPTSCGTSPSATGNNTIGTVTMGTGTPTGCVITFATAYNATPRCFVNWRANLAAMSYVVAAASITLTQTATSSNVVDYICYGG